jgi:hypothetical protein
MNQSLQGSSQGSYVATSPRIKSGSFGCCDRDLVRVHEVGVAYLGEMAWS